MYIDAYEKMAYEYIQSNHQNAVLSHPSPQPKTTVGGSWKEPIDIGSDSEGDTITTSGAFRASTPSRFQSQEYDSDASTKNLGKTFKIVLRSALTTSKEITLTVRPTTRCDAIVKAFITKAGLEEGNYPDLFAGDKGKGGKKGRKSAVGSRKDPRISLDGDKLANDTQIGQVGLEDGDMVEVVGL